MPPPPPPAPAPAPGAAAAAMLRCGKSAIFVVRGKATPPPTPPTFVLMLVPLCDANMNGIGEDIFDGIKSGEPILFELSILDEDGRKMELE